MDSNDSIRLGYDETPYRDQVFPHLDLSRLLGLARLFALGPQCADSSGLRVLDLGCSSGAHIREQAARYPGVRFTGIDFSRCEIEAGRKAVEESGLDNVELISSDLREVEVTPGDFDVILCHGTFSWVPDDVKDRIFQLCRTGLKPHGLAVIAYLTYPGWKQREAIRELLSFRLRNVEDPAERVRESALLLRLLNAGYSAHEDSCHAQSLKAVVGSMQQSLSNAFLHDELGPVHDPCYFIQFAEWASEWGLQYLAEVDLGTMAMAGLPTSAMGLLQQLAPDFLETQQLIDFLVNRSGRMSVLVRDDARIARELSVGELNHLEFTTSLENAGPRRSADEAACFRSAHGMEITLDDPCMSELVRRMSETATEAISFADLETCAVEQRHTASEMTRSLLALIAKGWAEPRLPIV